MRKSITGAAVLFVLFIAQACGNAHSDATRAELIPSPITGYKCFAVYDSDGKAVGGNCVKD